MRRHDAFDGGERHGGQHLARGLQGRDQFSGTAHLVGGAEALRTATGLLQQRCEEAGLFCGRTCGLRRPVLFFLCFYSEDPPSDPQPSGKLCTAHIITLHGDTVYDTAKWPSSGGVCKLQDYGRLERQTKRIFRVVPLHHPRCL